MEPTLEWQIRELFRRLCDVEGRLTSIEAATTPATTGAAVDDDADGQWGIGDIILAAEMVETRKSPNPGVVSPLICAWFDDAGEARSLARFVGVEVRFDALTNWFSVTFEATRVI